MYDLRLVFDCTLALVVLINPVSKIFVITTFSENTPFDKIKKVVIKASAVALGILFVFALTGNFVLQSIFHVNIYSLKIVGGIVLLLRGYQALNKGLFFETSATQRLEDLSIVPLASPMIAGPATIAASVSFPSIYGVGTTLIAICISVVLTALIMFLAPRINLFLTKFNIMGALIRITGLIVATIGIQMVLDGLRNYIEVL
ncbi:MarC family protein [Candidatus Omnitrophota bacterium]